MADGSQVVETKAESSIIKVVLKRGEKEKERKRLGHGIALLFLFVVLVVVVVVYLLEKWAEVCGLQFGVYFVRCDERIPVVECWLFATGAKRNERRRRRRR